MLKKVKTIKKEDLLVFISWLKGEEVFSNKQFAYNHLLEECGKEVVDIDIEMDYELFMLDLYGTYDKLSNIPDDELINKMEESPMFKILPKDIIDESMRKMESFCELYLDYMTTSLFEDITLKGKQKLLINKRIDQLILNEEYEKCIELKANLKELE